MPLAPVTPARDMYQKQKAKKKRLRTDTTPGKKLERISVMSRDQKAVTQEKGAIIITGRLCGDLSTYHGKIVWNFSKKKIEKYMP